MEDKLPILAIETSDELCSVALMIDKNSFFEASIKKKHVHSEKLIALIDQTLKLAEIEVKDINTIAVSEGPGSFTGLRIGMAVAKGLAIAQNCFFISVPTFDALALQISSYLADNDVFNIINNVNRDEVYLAKYRKSGTEVEVKEKLKLVDREKVELELNDGEVVYGSYSPNKSSFNIASPDAKYVALWTFNNGSEFITKDYDYIEPNYFKNFVVRGKSC